LDVVKRVLSRRQSEIIRREVEDIADWATVNDLSLPEKILVTGASGFIGQWVLAGLVELLKSNPGAVVHCETERYPEISQIWFPHLKKSMLKTFEQQEYDLIFDLSLPRSGPSVQEQIDQARHFYSNISKNARLLKENGRLVHPSSGAVYGELRFTDQLCEKLVSKPNDLSVYGEAKRGIEDLTTNFDTNSIDFITPRIFSVFGPLMREDSPLVGNIFIREAAKGNNVFASLSKNVFRDFCFITDLVKQLIYIGVQGSVVKNINLGSQNVAEISRFGTIISSVAKIDFEPGGISEKIDGYFGCLHELRKLPPFISSTETSLEEAVKKSVSFYKAIN
jgi:nucleoside-diphosphate-sugar epimerase